MGNFGKIALVSLGSNTPKGRFAATSFILKGRSRLVERVGGGDELMSALFATPAYPAGIGPDFVNAAIAMHTTLSATDLLAILHEIELEAQRTRTVRWGSRTLDLDLLALGTQIAPNERTQTRWRNMAPDIQRQAMPDRLILPHPRLQDRAFVLVPLAQIAPDWVHPVTGQSVLQMRDALPADDVAAIRPLAMQ
ncbi:2-amino-4-hydroxy-6-hydroxymethyldihydropteridine diphosphokinase [Loktanella sp. DJP18]|uniref:2-amino-4-hydroxy-6- hydroxymethyldihydropteridine diphosphokinase n=1 Tax=Loktanella sp. DJP18 TaxID=3409788 RepID=UPI003BB4A34A